MTLSRRKVLRILGSSALVLAAGAGGFLTTRTPGAALAAWNVDRAQYSDPRLRALSYAILAPNPHNRQPWLVELQGDHEIVLHCDLQRLLPETDPLNRQIVIGLGCFVELLTIAASMDGYRAEITPFPDGMASDHLDRRPVARIRLVEDRTLKPDPLAGFILQRHTNKEVYDTGRSVASDLIAQLSTAGRAFAMTSGTNDQAMVDGLRDLSWRAHMVETETRRTFMESVDLMRIGKAEINANPDGIDLGGPFLETLNLAGILTRETIADPASDAYRRGLDMYRELIHSAMGHLWVITPDAGRPSELAAGRAWMRIALQATRLGVGIHPLSQALQEYPEMDALRGEIDQKLDLGPGMRLQMFARLGYGPEIGPSPRWPLETRLRTS